MYSLFHGKNHEISIVNSNVVFLWFYVKKKTVFYYFKHKKKILKT